MRAHIRRAHTAALLSPLAGGRGESPILASAQAPAAEPLETHACFALRMTGPRLSGTLGRAAAWSGHAARRRPRRRRHRSTPSVNKGGSCTPPYLSREVHLSSLNAHTAQSIAIDCVARSRSAFWRSVVLDRGSTMSKADFGLAGVWRLRPCRPRPLPPEGQIHLDPECRCATDLIRRARSLDHGAARPQLGFAAGETGIRTWHRPRVTMSRSFFGK